MRVQRNKGRRVHAFYVGCSCSAFLKMLLQFASESQFSGIIFDQWFLLEALKEYIINNRSFILHRQL